eukprot:12139711-Prorocentrum_lima.AAC.1
MAPAPLLVLGFCRQAPAPPPAAVRSWRCSRKYKTARVSPAFHIAVAFAVAVAVAGVAST